MAGRRRGAGGRGRTRGGRGVGRPGRGGAASHAGRSGRLGGRRRDTRSPALAGALVIALALALLVSAIAGIRRDGKDDDDGARGAPHDAPAAAPRARPADPALGHVRVEVLNGSGRSGVALEGMRRLRADGFDVVFYGNADNFDHAASIVLDRSGEPARAHAVADALGIDSVAPALDSALVLDASVILGEDWPPAVPAAKPTLGERVRRLLRF